MTPLQKPCAVLGCAPGRGLFVSPQPLVPCSALQQAPPLHYLSGNRWEAMKWLRPFPLQPGDMALMPALIFLPQHMWTLSACPCSPCLEPLCSPAPQVLLAPGEGANGQPQTLHGGEQAAHTSPPLLGHRKPFPIGDKVTFSGKDCVCQNCSHSLISTKPIKIHGPSRKLTALVLRDGCKERDHVPLDGARGDDGTGFGASVQHCTEPWAFAEVSEEEQGSPVAPPGIAGPCWFRKLPWPVCDLGRYRHPGGRCLGQRGGFGAGFALRQCPDVALCPAAARSVSKCPGLLAQLSQCWHYSLPLQALKGFLRSSPCTDEPKLKLGKSNGQALLGGFGLAFDPGLFLGIPSIHAMLCPPSFSLLLSLCPGPLWSIPCVLCLEAGRASLQHGAAACRARFSPCPEQGDCSVNVWSVLHCLPYAPCLLLSSPKGAVSAQCVGRWQKAGSAGSCATPWCPNPATSAG